MATVLNTALSAVNTGYNAAVEVAAGVEAAANALRALSADVFIPLSYWRGIYFHMPGGGDEGGRRVMRFLFPGQDTPQFQDLGADDGQISVTGLIIGDDWLTRTQIMRDAFRTAGPGTLVHPWLGTLNVLLASKAQFTFSEGEVRAVRFQASFYRLPNFDDIDLTDDDDGDDTLGEVLAMADDVMDAVQSTLDTVLSLAALPLAFIGVVSDFVAGVSSLWSSLMGGGSGSSDFVAASASSLAALTAGVPGGPSSVSATGETYAQQIGDLLAATAIAIAGVVTATPQSMVSAGGDAVPATATTPDPRAAATLLLNMAAAITTTVAPKTAIVTLVISANAAGSPAPALVLVSQALILAQAATCICSIDFNNQQEAAGWLAQIDAALATLETNAALLAASNPLAFVALWQAIGNLRLMLAKDLNAEIGRLPPVETITLPMTMPAWLVAMHVSGDSPAAIIASYQDIVRRNGVRHPGMVPGGPIEVLE